MFCCCRGKVNQLFVIKLLHLKSSQEVKSIHNRRLSWYEFYCRKHQTTHSQTAKRKTWDNTINFGSPFLLLLEFKPEDGRFNCGCSKHLLRALAVFFFFGLWFYFLGQRMAQCYNCRLSLRGEKMSTKPEHLLLKFFATKLFWIFSSCLGV